MHTEVLGSVHMTQIHQGLKKSLSLCTKVRLYVKGSVIASWRPPDVQGLLLRLQQSLGTIGGSPQLVVKLGPGGSGVMGQLNGYQKAPGGCSRGFLFLCSLLNEPG